MSSSIPGVHAFAVKLREIFRFELSHQARRGYTWLSFALLFVIAFWVMGGSRPTDDDQLLFSPFDIAFFTVLGGAFWLLTAAPVAGEAAARDVQTRMHPLTYTAPVGKAEYLAGRFLAAFVLNGLILLAVPAGLLLALSLSDADPSRLAPFRPVSYFTAYGSIGLPLVFVATAIQFSWATLSRRSTASFLAGALLFASTFASLTVGHLLGRWDLVGLLDLVGFGGIITHLGETWTATEKNTRLVGLEGTLLANRLIWLAIAVGVLAFTYLRFRLAHPVAGTAFEALRSRRGRPSDRERSGEGPNAPSGRDIAKSSAVAVPQVRRAFGFGTHARQTLAIAQASFRAIARSWGGLVLLAAIPALVVLTLPGNMELMGVPLVPRTGHVLKFLTARVADPFTPWVIVPLLIVLYAGELVRREREAGLGDIADAAPVPGRALLLGKFLGLALVLIAWTALLATAGMLAQVRMGYHDLEVGLYLQVLFGLQLPEYLLFALLAFVVQALVDRKYLGHLVALAAYGFIAFASKVGIEHDLLVYGAAPGWSYTEMRGFGPSLGPWLWFKAYWAAWALLLAVVARLLWVRGREGGLAARLRQARRRLTRPTARAGAAAAGLVLALGGFVFYNTNVLNEYVSTSDGAERRAEYERRYGRYEGIPQPRLASTGLQVEIDPERRAVDVRGTYRLVNRSAVAIESVHVATVPGVETGEVTLDRPAARVLADEELGHRIYALETPLQPGDSLRLDFRVHVEPRGFHESGADASVAANGTFFTNKDWLPAIGYQGERELADAGMRRAHGLAPRPSFRSLYDVEAERVSSGEESTAFEAVVGTSEDQVAVAPGALRRTWTENGRRYFRYSTSAPIGDTYAFASADYAVREARWSDPSVGRGRDVAIRIFHHPEHTRNLDRMLRSVRVSLDHYTEELGPYPYRHLSLVERTGLGGMHAHASMITFQEGFSLFDPESDPRALDLPFSVVAHEVAHQWWGSHLAPARVEGNPVLSESLAQYSAYQVVERTYGPEHLRRLVLSARRAQEAVPRQRADAPLLRGTDPFHQYRKGPWALYAVSESIGEARVNRALRRLLAQHGSGALVTTLDLAPHDNLVDVPDPSPSKR